MTAPGTSPARIGLPDLVADWPEPWKFDFEERAAILEFCANMTREHAELLAEQVLRRQYWQEKGQ